MKNQKQICFLLIYAHKKTTKSTDESKTIFQRDKNGQKNLVSLSKTHNNKKMNDDAMLLWALDLLSKIHLHIFLFG